MVDLVLTINRLSINFWHTNEMESDAFEKYYLVWLNWTFIYKLTNRTFYFEICIAIQRLNRLIHNVKKKNVYKKILKSTLAPEIDDVNSKPYLRKFMKHDIRYY